MLMLFMTLYAIYCTFFLPILYIYISRETYCFDILSNEDYFLVMLKIIVMLIPGVAPVVAFIVYRKHNRKNN